MRGMKGKIMKKNICLEEECVKKVFRVFNFRIKETIFIFLFWRRLCSSLVLLVLVLVLVDKVESPTDSKLYNSTL
jgi:hypothetical protein